jgi:histidine triad (HIT) family protein
MNDCLFCKIAKKEIESSIIYEDERVIAFRDIKPAAKVHVLIIPKKHIEGLTSITPEDKDLIGHISLTANKIAEQEKIDESGFRLLVNSGADAGQIIGHLHFHLLGGEKLKAI